MKLFKMCAKAFAYGGSIGILIADFFILAMISLLILFSITEASVAGAVFSIVMFLAWVGTYMYWGPKLWNMVAEDSREFAESLDYYDDDVVVGGSKVQVSIA